MRRLWTCFTPMNLKFIVYTQFINLPIDECIVTVVCKLPSEAGRCQGDFPRFFYDMDMKKCRQFTYGGCRGNQNNFDTLQECQQFCESVMRDQGMLLFTGYCCIMPNIQLLCCKTQSIVVKWNCQHPGHWKDSHWYSYQLLCLVWLLQWNNNNILYTYSSHRCPTCLYYLVQV